MKASNLSWRLCATTLVCSLAAVGATAQQKQSKPSSCANCGVVESVQTVQRTEKPKGIAGSPVTPGMAIGGVVGGVAGHQLGSGGGNTAATVLGAAGGAYAGHKIEEKRYTAYVMRVRMNDGSTRTVEQRHALAKGSHVVIDGKTAHLQQSSKSQG